MSQIVETIQLPLWLYNDLKALAVEEQADDLVDVIAQLVKQAKQRQEQVGRSPTHAFERILAEATDLGVSDLAVNHDHYLYGVEKR